MCVLTPGTLLAAHPPRGPATPLIPTVLDHQRRIDANQLNMWVSNYGSFAWDLSTGNPGLEFPKGTGRTAIFASGLWLGARVSGNVRTVVAEYSQEFGPGTMSGGTFDNPGLADFRVYKVTAWTGDPQDSVHVDDPTPGPLADPLVHHSWSEYLNGAAPYGAPTRTYRLPNPSVPGDSVNVEGPDVVGDRMLWAVYNDADPLRHTNDAGDSQPLGVEIQQTTYAFDSPGPFGVTAFLGFRIINKGVNLLEDAYISAWSDPDVGGFSDDLVGCDTTLSLGYAYNANNADPVYGATPPAVGYVLLQGPRGAAGELLGMTAFSKLINGTDPHSAQQTYNFMMGLQPDGSPVIDNLGQPTMFFHAGDPVAATGWLDSNPADRRMILTSGPFQMAPGDTQEIKIAIVVGQGNNRLESISALKANAIHVAGGPAPPPPPPPPTNCPRDPQFWAAQCGPGGGGLSSQQVSQIAAHVDDLSNLFDWPAGTDFDGFCSEMSVPAQGDLRAEARREFAAALANRCAGVLGIVPTDGLGINLVPSTPISCPELGAQSIDQLLAPAILEPALTEAEYLDHNTANPSALAPVNWGGPVFGGGGSTGWDFWGGTLDPSAMPDSFSTVEVRFDSANPQFAYRYLRLEVAGGGAPNGGREYRYGGFHPVGFQVWDVANNVQLDVAFVERTVTDASGTILSTAAQVATFDSTWAPDASGTGGREFLFILRRPYGATAKSEFMVDGAMDTAPIMYNLWARRGSFTDVIDDGDAFRFVWSQFSGPGADARLLELQGQSTSDPEVQQAYAELIQCVGDVNRGIGLENPCDFATPTLISLHEARAEPDRVTLAWYTSTSALAATLERRDPSGPWASVSSVHADGSGAIRYEDRQITPGTRYGYRLTFVTGGEAEHAGEVWVDVPARHRLALAGFVPNPARGNPAIEFVLASREPARMEIFDLLGRRVASREVGHMGPGRVALRLNDQARLRSGIYVLALTQGTVTVRKKAVFVR